MGAQEAYPYLIDDDDLQERRLSRAFTKVGKVYAQRNAVQFFLARPLNSSEDESPSIPMQRSSIHDCLLYCISLHVSFQLPTWTPGPSKWRRSAFELIFL